MPVPDIDVNYQHAPDIDVMLPNTELLVLYESLDVVKIDDCLWV